MKKIAKHKTLWKMNSTSEPLLITGVEGHSLKKFTIPKIRRASRKVYLSPCFTNTREYSFIHDTLNQCRLDVSCDLQSSWQFGDTKLVRNEDLEKNFTSKRSEMRENGRHGRELEENFCFLALPQSDVAEIYYNGISSKASTLKILGNPLLGIYIFRHVDVALNYAHSRSINVENIIVFKVLFGKVKKIQPSVDKNKVSLDPSPNFDCHMSRNTPSPKDTIELQAYNSAVYFYEYNGFSNPVDKPRQCLPYAVVTVKFIGQKLGNRHLMTSLRFLSTGFPKRAGRTCCLNNCTVAKRIGKGKDATIIFEHFRKPVDRFVQENCSCSALSSEINSSNSNISNCYENVQNGNISVIETHSGQMKHSLTQCGDTSQVQADDSGLSFIPSDTKENVNGDLLNLTHLKNVLSGLPATFPLHNNVGSSTVITSKSIKDPRLMRREESVEKRKHLNNILPFKKSLDFVNSGINLTMPTNSASSKVMPGDDAILTNCLDAPCLKISFDDSQAQAHNMGFQDCSYYITPNKLTIAGQYQDQDNFSFPMYLSNGVPEVKNQKHSAEKAQRSQQRSNIPLLIEQNSEPCNSYQSVNTFTKEYDNHISQESQSSNLKTTCQPNHQVSAVFQFQKEESIHECIQNIGKVRNFTGLEDGSKHIAKQSLWEKIDNCHTNETKISPIDNSISLHQECKEDESLNYLGGKCGQRLIPQELEISKSSTSTTNYKYELDYLALELQNNLTPRVESLSQKHPQHCLENEDDIHSNFAISQKLIELKLERTNQNCVSIITDAFQEAKDISQVKDLPMDIVILSHDIKTGHDNSNCSIAKEHACINRKNKNDPMLLERIHRDFGTSQVDNKGPGHTLFCNAQLNNDIHFTVNFKEQRDDTENQNEDKGKDTASSTENNIENICGDERQGFHTNKSFIIDERWENKNYNNVEILSSEELTTFNLSQGKKFVSTETTLLETEDILTAIKQKDTQNTVRSVKHPGICKISDSSEHVASNAILQINSTMVPTLETNGDHQRFKFKRTCSSESPDWELVKCRVSDYEIHMDKNKLHNSFHKSVSDNVVLKSIELESEIEVVSEDCDDAFPPEQDTHSHGNTLYEEFGTIYEELKSRIDWESLLGSSKGEKEVLRSTTRREHSDQHYSDYASTQKNKAELFNPILLPDLQIRITNTLMPGISSTVKSFSLKDNICKYITEATKPEISDEEGKVPGFEIYSQCCENSRYSFEDEFGDTKQESGIVSDSEISVSFDFSDNKHVNHMSKEKGSGPLLTEPSSVKINNESRCSLTNSKTVCSDVRSKNTESRIIKRKLHTPFRDQSLPHQEICEKKRRLTNQDSSECFSALSEGRIKTFSQSEKHIRSVLDILNSEVSLCKSKCLSKKLDSALLYLKKAHRRVNTSLELIAKVGETRKGPLPKSYKIICNNFWEICDLQGYGSVSERRYYSTKHFFPKRKYDKPGEKRALGFEVNKSLTHVSKYQFDRTSEERTTKCFSKKNVANSVSKSHSTIHMGEFCDQEYPESQLTLGSTSQSTSQSTYNNIYMKNPESSELQPFSGKMGCLFFPDCPDEKLTKKVHQVDIKSLSNINKYEKPENHLAHNNEDAVKESAEANKVINQTNSVSLTCIKENNVSFSADENYDATCIAHAKIKTDIVISVLESDVKHFLNVDNYKPDNLISPGYKRNLEVNFLEKWTSPSKNSIPGTITGNVHLDPLHQTLITSQKCNTLPQLAAAPVADNEREPKKTYLDEQRAFAVDSFSTCTNVAHCQQECSRKKVLKTEEWHPSSCVHIDRNETHVIENSELDLIPVTEESKSYRENIMKRLFFSDSSLLLKDDIKGSSKKCISKKNIPDRKRWEIKQTEKAIDSVHKKSMTERSTLKNEYRNQKNKILANDACISEKTIKNNLIDSHQSIKSTTEAICLNKTVSNQLNDRKKEGRVKVSIASQSDSTLHSELACNSKPDILGVNRMPFLHAHSEISKVSTPQKNPTSYMNKIKEKHCAADHSGLTARLAQILRRADEASSLQKLQEETKVCQSILPLFVEAFEKKQECSLEQILISRELLVEKNMWNNCKHKLKPCAIDSLVELQMMMETIQFIENKKRLLGGEPTFRSLLWYDETLYSELLGRPRGFQQQSNFYPAFQGRLKYNAFCELQNYHDQLIELLGDTKKENNSYYAFLKCKRQIKECEAILRHCSDCFDFTLSVPFTCGVNFGDNLGDLETLRKSTLKLISMYGDSPKVDSYPGKRDHLWIIIEMISSKVNFIKSSEAAGINVSLFGLEHIFFDAAKSLVWKEKKRSFSKKYSGQKNKGTLLKMNQHSFSKLQEIYDILSKDLRSEQISNTRFEENTVMASRKPDDLINKAKINIENCRLNSTSISHPDICCISEILDEAKFADFKTLQELTLRCTNHLEVLKQHFQMLQEDNRDDIFITEENVLDVLENHNHESIILKSAATETYIEIAMLSETVHFLKNLMAKKLDKQRFRGMLWFDLSLLPELVRCQEKMASFSFLKDNATDHLWKVIETAISELKKDLDITYKYNEAINCSYALHLFSRELEELSEIKKLLKKSKYSISTYIDFVPYIASINYGNTMTQLEYNYNQFSTLLKNLLAASRKDLGKMAHTVKVMKTIEHMKIICAKNAELTLSFILCQMLHNRENTFQLQTDERMNVCVKPRRNINKSSICLTVPSECIIKNVSDSSRKRRITVDKYQDSQEQEKNSTVSSCKKRKVNEKGVAKINREKATFKHPRTTRSHPRSESETGPSSSGNLKRNYGSPKKVEMQRSLPASPLPLKNLKDTCMLKLGGKIDLTNISSDTSEEFTGHQEKVNSMKKRNVNFSTGETKNNKKDCSSFAICDQKSVHGTFSKDHETPSQKKLLNNSPDPSDIKPGTDATFLSNALVPSKPIFCFVSDIHANLEMSGTVFELQDNEILNSSIKNCTGTKSPEPMFIQNKIPLQQISETLPAKTESKEKYVKDTMNPSTVPVETSESITLNVNQTAEQKNNKNCFSEQKKNKNSKVLTQNAATHWSELPQATCTPIYNSSEHSFGTVSPSCGWYVYHYSSSNGSFITQTYQSITSFEVQSPSSEILTAVPSTVQNIHSNLLLSQYFGYFPGEPQAYGLMPANRYFPSQMPVSSNVQQPAFSQCASYQLLPQAAYPYPPDLGVLPQVLWTYVPWQHQELFHPGR